MCQCGLEYLQICSLTQSQCMVPVYPFLLLDTNILSPHLVPHLKIGLLSLEFSFFLFFLFCYCCLQCVAAFYEAQCPQTILLLPLPSSTVLSTFKTKWEKIFKILRLPSVTQDKFKDTNCIFLKNLRGSDLFWTRDGTVSTYWLFAFLFVDQISLH